MFSTQTLARRLLYTMLPWYLLLVLSVIGIHLTIEYYSLSLAIGDDLASLGRTVEPGVTQAVWELDAERLAFMTRGVRQNAIVSGVQIKTEEGDVLIADGDLRSAPDERGGPVSTPYKRELVPLYHQAEDGERGLIGYLDLYSNYDVLWARIKYNFFVVLLNSIVVSSGLWLMFSWTIRFRLSNSLTRVAGTVAGWRSKTGEILVEKRDYPFQDEVGELVLALNEMFETVETRRRELVGANQSLAESEARLKSANEDLEERIKVRTAELRAIFDSASVGIVQMRDRVILRCNRRLDEMFGYAEGEQIGQPTRIWYANEADWIAGGEPVYQQTRQGGTHVREQLVKHKDGGPFWVRMSGRAIDVADLDKGFVSVIEDITAERAAREAMLKAKGLAEEATRMKSEFLANMSHEIRTPMNAVLGMLYLALKPDLPPSLYSYLSKAQNAAHSLMGIINDILDFSKIEAGRLEIEDVEFGLDAVLEQLSDAVGLLSGQKGVEFLIRYDQQIPPTLIGDPLRLGQVLRNLCGNAIKFTEQGEVELAFRALSHTDDVITMQVSVRDTGIGMTPEAQGKLFEKFTQADQTTTRRFGGTGLGLAIAKQLVELMGGRIWVEESEPGKGTTICFTVPLKISRQAQVYRHQLVEQVGPLLKGIRVLVVDDNDVSREILTEMLRFFQLDVGVATNGPSALAAIKAASEKPIDLVLMDWRMPGMNGDEVTRRLHGDTTIVSQPKVVMVTAYGREDVIRLAEQAGVDGFLIKPVSPSTLLDTILSVLGRGQILDKPGKDGDRVAGVVTAGCLVGARLLLVEDNDINREFAGELLRSEGMDVDEAVTGREAIDKVRQHAYDAVLMDIQMPVMDGLEAARLIRGLADAPGGERFATLPIIAMTALAMAHDAEKSHAAGMNDHVTKPIVPERLLSALVKWIHLPQDRVATAKPFAATVSAATEFPADLAALGSLDAREGVRRIGGRLEAYRKQLRRFRDHYSDAVTELHRLVRERRLDGAEDYCHALKGVCGNIGAVALYEKTVAIDSVLRRGEIPDDAALDEMRVLLEQVIADIDGLAISVAPRVSLNQAEIKDRLERLRHALEYDLGDAEGLLAELRAGLAGDANEQILNDIADKADVFALDEALALVDVLYERLQFVI